MANMRATSNNGDDHELPKDVEERLGNWKPPKVPIYDVFHRKGLFSGLFDSKPNDSIKTLEKTVKIRGERVDFQLFDRQTIEHHKSCDYTHLCFGLVQIGVKPLTRNGLNKTVLVSIRDARCLEFKHSLLSVGESSLSNGPFYFNCYPNWCLPLSDAQGALTLNVKTVGLGDDDDYRSPDIEVFYRVYYKVMINCFKSSGSKITNSMNKNTVIQTNLLKNGVPVKKTINWDSVEELENGDFRINPTNQEEDEEEATYEEALVGPLPGGPEDPSVLTSFKTHIAAAIWEQQERDPLICINNASKVVEWAWDPQSPQTAQFTTIIRQSELLPLVGCSYHFANKMLISAFVERWQPETNTFHMPFGEMTITLDDVSVILGIPVLGRSIFAPMVTSLQDSTSLLQRALGVTATAAHDELTRVCGQFVRLEWLRDTFSKVTDDQGIRAVEYAARAYLLYLLGCTLFTDKSGTRVSVHYLVGLLDLGRVHTYAWGAAGLAYTYRQLGLATRKGTKQIAGFMTILEAWIYEHFRAFRPSPNLAYKANQPRARQWTPYKEYGGTIYILQVLRERLDVLGVEEVLWDPYSGSREQHPFQEIAYYTGCIKCIDVVEPYHPDRVLRQFGRVQMIPLAPLSPMRAIRGSTASQYKVVYQYLDQMWERWQNHVLRDRSVPVTPGQPDCMGDYMDWYKHISHLTIQHPDHRVTYGEQQSTPSHTIGDVHIRLERALKISRPILDMGEDRGVQQPQMLYSAITQISHVLEGDTQC